MTKLGFYFDAESCIACHTCQVACKDVHNLPVGANYRTVRSFCTGGGFEPRSYNVSLSMRGCNLCADLREIGEEPACVASCPMRALEFGDIDELRAEHAGEPLEDHCAAIANEDMANRNFIMRVKDCMMDPDFDEYLI
jgi:Fe-S-cluster-containing dehydrogenase component